MYPDIMNDVENSDILKQKLQGYVQFDTRRGVGGMALSWKQGIALFCE